MTRYLIPAILLATTTAASAHAMLEHAVPAAGADMPTSPKTIMLEYSEGLEPVLSSVAVTDASGHDVTSSAATVSDSHMVVTLKPLAPGVYRVAWHAVSTDTHRTQGKYEFRVGK